MGVDLITGNQTREGLGRSGLGVASGASTNQSTLGDLPAIVVSRVAPPRYTTADSLLQLLYTTTNPKKTNKCRNHSSF